MITRTKILIVLMSVLLLVSGVVYAQGPEGNPDQQNGTEIMEEEEYRAGLLTLEDLLEIDPALEDLAEEYQMKLDEIKTADSEDKETQINNLKTEYTALSINQAETNLIKFAEEFGLDLLVINQTALYNPKELNPDNIKEFQNMRTYFQSYLNDKSNKTESNDLKKTEDNDSTL